MPNDEDTLAELLQQWEDSTQQGEEVSLSRLCQNSPHLLPELETRVAKLKAAGWMVRFQAVPDSTMPESIPGYRLLSRIGQGGFGQVWKARAPGGQFVALKFIDLASEASSEWRMIEKLKAFRHPNVLTILDACRTESAIVLVLELADCSLQDRFAECSRTGLPGIPAVELRNYLRDAGSGLDALHAVGIAHRDVKPSNLLLVEGVVKVADLGLAKELRRPLTNHTGTMTPSYAAPEYFDGKTSHAGDQYGLAITYCQLLGGRLPFEGTPVAVMTGHLRHSPDLTMIPVNERTTVAKALAKKPQHRWPSCSAFVENLSKPQWQSAGDEPTKVFPSSRRWWYCSLAGALCLPLLGFAFWLVFSQNEKPTQQTEASPLRGPEEDTPREQEFDLDTLPAFVFDGKSRIVTSLERFAPVSLECWARPEINIRGRSEKYLIGSDIPLQSGIGIGYTYFHNKPPAVLFAQLLPAPVGRDINTYTVLPLDRWSHVAAVFERSRTVIYLDGKEIARGPATNTQGGTVFVIGNAGRNNPDHFFNGRMRGVRISQGARYTENFTPARELQPDASSKLVYSASQTREKQAIDLCGEYHGDLQGVTVFTPH